MIKDKVEIIVQTLIDATKNSQLEWVEKGPQSKRDYHREFVATAEDGTKYETEVKFILNNNSWSLESGPSIWVRSNKLPNGTFYIYGGEFQSCRTLRDAIKTKYCSDMSPSEQIIEDALEDITKGISLSTLRDNKLNKIL